MGNYAYLIASKNDGPPDVYPEDSSVAPDLLLLESKYAIPALWLTLFDSDSLRSFKDPEEEVEVQYLGSERAAAIARVEEAVENFCRAFGNAETYCSQWLEFLRSTDCDYFKAELDEVLAMLYRPGELENALSCLSNPNSETINAYFSLTSLPDVLNERAILDREESASEYSTLQRLIGVPA